MSDKNEQQEEKLVMVEDPPEGSQPPKQDPPDDDEDDDSEAGGTTDARAGHTEGEEEGEDSEKASRRQERQDRKRRQREARERNDRELNFLRRRNESLERQFSELEARQRKGEHGQITSQIQTLESQIEEAKQVEAAAIAANEGEDAVEARDIRQALEKRRDQLSARQQELRKPAARAESTEVPPEAQLALGWIDRNPWYDPQGRDENSAIAQVVEASLLRQGLRPTTEEYWTELDKRLRVRIPEVFEKTGKQKEVKDDDDEEEEEAPPPRVNGSREQTPPPKRKPAGPVVTVGGQKRTLKPNEVYISPARRQAMEEAGVWDDPVLRDRQLAQYRKWDQEHGNT